MARDTSRRVMGSDSKAPPTAHVRLVDRLVLHGEPLSFREVCRRAVPTTARYVVLDLDRTVHLGRNMGELLGWEMCAHAGYGDAYLDELEGRRGMGRVFVARSDWLGSLRYLWLGARTWGLPGLYYLLWGKAAAHAAPLRRQAFLRFGPEPVSAVQRAPQTALLCQMASLPLATLRELALRVWHRYEPDLVVQREDIDWLRRRCPGVTIIISSASPQPMLEVAAQALGVDDVVYSRVEEHDGFLGAPFDASWMTGLPSKPHWLSHPSQQRINAGRAKIDELLARYPDLADPKTESVGITDTGYGEDHSWAQLFTVVIDVNSTAPFPPIVEAGSPVRAIHSALVLTRSELQRRTPANQSYLDPRRGKRRLTAFTREFSRTDLQSIVGRVASEVDGLADELRTRASALRGALGSVLAEVDALDSRIEDAVTEYNRAESSARDAAMRCVRELLDQRRALSQRRARLERPISEAAFSIAELLDRSRALLDECVENVAATGLYPIGDAA
ncbi:MAG: hypothetical protein U0271_38930 [Polyangiaceae bacterium]